MVTADYYLYTE